MKRTNVLALDPARGHGRRLFEVALGCAKLWNELTHKRRQDHRNYQTIEWYPKGLYRKYAPLVGSATAQQIINKNNEAWRSFLALKRLEKRGKLPSHIESVKPPGFWKDRDGKYRLSIVLRNDCYGLEDGVMKLPRGFAVPFKGKPKWFGRQGRAEILYDDLSRKWRVFQTVEARSSHKPRGFKTCHIDLGVVNLATIWVEGWRQPMAFSGRRLLSDWWHWTGKIAECQSRLKRINDRRTSKRLRRLYRMRRRRFRHAVNAMIRNVVEDLYELGVSRIVIGNLKHIRDGNGKHGAKANSMIHNFWGFRYTAQRLRDVAEEYGIEVEEVSEYKTSTRCVRCGSENTIRSGRLFRCLSCGLEAHRDVVGVLNMANLHHGGTAIGVVAHPSLLRWDGMRWEAKRPMNDQPMRTLEARIPQASAVGVSRSAKAYSTSLTRFFEEIENS